MKTYPLHIGTPDGMKFEGEVERVKLRTITGDLAILAGHVNYCTAIGMGEAYVRMEDGSERYAACIGGMLSVMNGTCHLLSTTWEWKEDIDIERAKASKARSEAILAEENLDPTARHLAEAALARAEVRISVAEG